MVATLFALISFSVSVPAASISVASFSGIYGLSFATVSLRNASLALGRIPMLAIMIPRAYARTTAPSFFKKTNFVVSQIRITGKVMYNIMRMIRFSIAVSFGTIKNKQITLHVSRVI